MEREVIVIEDSPVRPEPSTSQVNIRKPVFPGIKGPPTVVKEKKEPHPFFARSSAPSKAISSKPAASQSLVANDLPPWPTTDSIHCGWVPLEFTSQSCLFPKKFTSPSQAEDGQSQTWLFNLTHHPKLDRPMQTTTSFDVVESIPEAHRTHPAISRLISWQDPDFSPHRIWNDKYSPRNTNEMLHNAARSIYLQQWLKALEVQMDGAEATQENRGVKRPRPKVQRDVGKKRGRKRQKVSDDPFGGLDDFIADDDEWDSEEGEEDEDAFLSAGEELPRASTMSSPISSRATSPLPPPLLIPRGTRSRPSARRIIESSPAPSSPSVAPPEILVPDQSDYVEADEELSSLTERLTNTILLSGPSGAGKTAAVYACAEELKWKVFEFYPGIGKRSGAGFMAEVGGTGDNHRVGGMEKEQRGSVPLQTLGFLTSPSKKRAPTQPLSENDTQDVRQSLILVEEADVLYQSDGNLWPTLVNFIRKSRRPVILTCNGTYAR